MRFGQYVMLGAAVAVLVAAGETFLFAQVAAVPEIDGASLSAGLGLLAGGWMMLRARRSLR